MSIQYTILINLVNRNVWFFKFLPDDNVYFRIMYSGFWYTYSHKILQTVMDICNMPRRNNKKYSGNMPEALGFFVASLLCMTWGLSSARLEKLFRPLVQAEQTESRLQLSIMQSGAAFLLRRFVVLRRACPALFQFFYRQRSLLLRAD